MAKRALKARVLELRLNKQLSYSQIKKLVPVSKSSLSLWLRNYPLSEKRIRELRDWSEVRIEKYRETRRQQREARFRRYVVEEKAKIGNFTKRDLLIAGLAIFWGEGGKTSRGQLTISNTDPSMMRLVKYWFIEILGFTNDKIRVRLQLYKDMNIKQQFKYWSRQLNLPQSSFTKPLIKITTTDKFTHKGLFGHGTCELKVFSTEAEERMLASLHVLSDYFSHLAV